MVERLCPEAPQPVDLPGAAYLQYQNARFYPRSRVVIPPFADQFPIWRIALPKGRNVMFGAFYGWIANQDAVGQSSALDNWWCARNDNGVLVDLFVAGNFVVLPVNLVLIDADTIELRATSGSPDSIEVVSQPSVASMQLEGITL